MPSHFNLTGLSGGKRSLQSSLQAHKDPRQPLCSRQLPFYIRSVLWSNTLAHPTLYIIVTMLTLSIVRPVVLFFKA